MKNVARIIKTLVVVAIISSTVNTVSAQKFAYVDTDYILSNIPEYKEAQEELDLSLIHI